MPVGNGPHGVSIGDLNADGKPDLIVTAGNSGITAIFKNTSDSTGHISFAPQININSLQHADHIAVVDLDGDGKPEIISADFSGNSIPIWRNTSSGGIISFAARISYTAGTNPVAVCAGDFDNDGKTDIAVANYSSNTVSVFKNNSSIGSISFTNKQDYATGTEPRYIALGDLDGDGKPDIVVPNDYNSISILRNRIDEPIISSFTPVAAKTDSVVTIKGENLKGTTAVSFGGTPASSFTIVADSIITAKVGSGSNGVVQVLNTYGNDTLGLFTYIPPAPIIKSFSPVTGSVGTEVRIVGDHFRNATSIRFGGMDASSFSTYDDTVIIAIVGKGATRGVTVSNAHGSDTLSKFTFIPPIPVITSFIPTAGTTGTPITIIGENFKWIKGVNFANLEAASYIVKNDSTIVAVPGKGASGVISITNEFGTDTLGTFIFLEPNALTAYPNPAVGVSMLAHPAIDHSSQLKLVGMNGRVIRTIAVPRNEAQTRIDVTNVPPGIYKVVWSDGQASLTYTILVP